MYKGLLGAPWWVTEMEKTPAFALKFTILIKIILTSCLIHVDYQTKAKNNQEEKLRILFSAFVIVSVNRLVSQTQFCAPEEMGRIPCSSRGPGFGESQAERWPRKQPWLCLRFAPGTSSLQVSPCLSSLSPR